MSFLPSTRVFWTHSAQTCVGQEDRRGEKCQSIVSWFGCRGRLLLNRQNVPQPLPPAHYALPLPPNSGPCANSLRVCKEGFAVHTVLIEASAVHERVSAWMNWALGPAGVKRAVCEPFIFILMTRLSDAHNPTLSEKGNMFFFFFLIPLLLGVRLCWLGSFSPIHFIFLLWLFFICFNLQPHLTLSSVQATSSLLNQISGSPALVWACQTLSRPQTLSSDDLNLIYLSFCSVANLKTRLDLSDLSDLILKVHLK